MYAVKILYNFQYSFIFFLNIASKSIGRLSLEIFFSFSYLSSYIFFPQWLINVFNLDIWSRLLIHYFYLILWAPIFLSNPMILMVDPDSYLILWFRWLIQVLIYSHDLDVWSRFFSNPMILMFDPGSYLILCSWCLIQVLI